MTSGYQTTQGPAEDRLTQAETRQALLVAAIAWGVFGSAWMNLIGGAPFVSFARKLGASTFVFGLLNSLPFLGVLAQLPTSYIVEKVGRRKPLFLACGIAQRLLWFGVAALPWLIPPLYQELRVAALLVLLMLSSTLGNAASPAWLSWFADFVPVEIRGRYLGKRAALATMTGVVAAGAAGWALDRSHSYPVFAVIFAISAFMGLMDIVLFFAVRETAMVRVEGPAFRLRNVVLEPLGSAPFRRYLLYALSEAFMFGIAGPFFWLMGLEELKIGGFWSNFYIMMVPMIFTAMALPSWGNACDRFGSRPLVAFGTIMSIAFPVCWLLATPEHFHTLLAIGAVVGGGLGAAIQVADMNMLLGLTPRVNRSSYTAMLAMAASLGLVLAPSLSGALAEGLKGVHIYVGGRAFGNFHFLMAISVVARVLHVLFVVPRLPETPKGTTGALARYLCGWPMRRLAGVFGRTRV